VLHIKRTDAPGGECQAGNGFGPEPAVLVLDESWYAVETVHGDHIWVQDAEASGPGMFPNV
jgi:hypothetical protein